MALLSCLLNCSDTSERGTKMSLVLYYVVKPLHASIIYLSLCHLQYICTVYICMSVTAVYSVL